ncbi:MAG: response regulator, partial [Azonexus sp.]|nr:response regulator [Azonexus sp.]
LVTLAVIFTWNRTLRQQVKARTTELETERLHLEQRVLERTAEITESEERFRHLFVMSSTVMLIIDQTSGEIIDANDAAAALYGYPKERLTQMLINEINTLPPDRIAEERRHALREERNYFMFQHRLASGDERDVEVYSTPIHVKGKALLFSIVHDVSQRKLAETELKRHRDHLEELVTERTTALSIAKEAAEAANRAKSTFLANMSHELRTPMNAIMGMTSMALRRAEDPTIRDQLGKIDKATQHLLAVINDVLDISKIEAERLTLEQSNFMLGEILEDLTSMIGHKATEKGLQLRIELAPTLTHLALRGDPLRLGQILLNLTGNALKFTEAGSITLRVRPIEESPLEVLLRFEVEDTGIGISAEDQKRLFTAFEQADGSMTRKYGGTGLGLAISKRLAILMGGDVGADSEPGVGSIFWLAVRFGKSAEVVPPAHIFTGDSAETQLKTQFAGARILLAEDEPINQEVSRGLLEDVNLQVDLAENGAEALALAQKNTYDLILMDMQMPKLNGIDATRAIRKLPGYAETPILAMTANAFVEDRRRCIEAGMNDHIGKPVDPKKLFEVLLKWLARGK